MYIIIIRLHGIKKVLFIEGNSCQVGIYCYKTTTSFIVSEKIGFYKIH